MDVLLAKWLVFCIILYVVVRPFHAALFFTRPPRIRIHYRTPDDLGPYENVTLTSRDDTRLVGWYLPSRNQAAVILLHGHSGNRLGVMYHAEKLVQAGFGVLLFDLRRHGSSGGGVFSRGEAERDDVLTAVTYLSHRPDVKAGGIGLFGLSVGGMLALQAAAQTVAIHAVAVDGASPATMADLPAPTRWLDRYLHWPLQAGYMWLSWHFSRGLPLPANITVLSRLRQPVLFISTGRATEAAMMRHYLQATPTSKTLWEIPEAHHATGWRVRPEEYGERLVSFFASTLTPTVSVSPSPTDGE